MKRASPIDTLKLAVPAFAARHPETIKIFKRGQRVINEAEEGDDFYVIQDGSVAILVKDHNRGRERHIALRFSGDVIGETAILRPRGKRNASVEVISDSATLIQISRQDVLQLLKSDAEVSEAIVALWELSVARVSETQQVMAGNVRVENKVMSALLADIHGFSALGEIILDELSNNFTFDFLESSEAISKRHGGRFEPQGDGFKVTFEGTAYATQAVQCGAALRENFIELRRKWRRQSEAFSSIGFGIGICTDCMSIKRQVVSAQTSGMVVSHAMSIAAALSKKSTTPTEVEIYLDEATAHLMRTNEFSVEGPDEIFLEPLRRKQIRHRLVVPASRSHKEESAENLDHGCRDNRISILFVSSDPSNELRLAEEVRGIREDVRRHRNRFDFFERHAVRPADLSQALLDLQPNIVHMSGHGTGAEGICLQGDDGRPHLVSTQALSRLFREFSNAIQCVILNTCYSDQQADAIGEHIKYVIGMDGEISDAAAIAFGKGFYQALGAGRGFDEAHRLGCVQIGLMRPGTDEDAMPILKTKK